MKLCPNPSCPHWLRGKSPAEFYDEKRTCSDCGADLVGAGEAPSSAEGARVDGAPEAAGDQVVEAALYRRLAVTLILPLLVVLVGPWAPLPGVDMGALEQFVSSQGSLLSGARSAWGFGSLSAFALGIMPVLMAFVIVELAAAFVAKWQPLRHGGPAARAKLTRAALIVALALAVFQGYGVAQTLESAGFDTGLVLNPGILSRILITLTLAAGTFLTFSVAEIARQYGLGSGILGMLAISMVFTEIGRYAWLWSLPTTEEQIGPLEVAVMVIGAALIVAATLLVLGVRWSALLRALSRRSLDREIAEEARFSYRAAPPSPPARAPLPCPASGIAPLLVSVWLLSLPSTLFASIPGMGWLASVLNNTNVYTLSSAALIAALGVWLSSAWNEPARVAAVRARLDGGGADPQELEAEAKADLRRAIGRTLAFLVGITVIKEVVGRVTGQYLDPIVFVLVTVVILDIRADYLARRRSLTLVSVWPEHRPYAVDVALRALAAEGIWAHAQNANGRAMLQLFGPFVPIEIMVQPGREGEAREVLERVLNDERFKEPVSIGAGAAGDTKPAAAGSGGEDEPRKRTKKRRRAEGEGPDLPT